MSASREGINTKEAPPPRPFYNQAVVANGFVFCSGQLPKDATGKIVPGTVQDRANQCIKNLKAVLESAGSSLQWFGEIKPVRTCVAVKSIPEYTDVEMKCVALL